MMIAREWLPLPIWAWPTVLALDAPLVAVVWYAAFARTLGEGVAAGPAMVLGLSVWLIYAADRWLDGLRLRPGVPATARHALFALWRWPFLQAWLAVLALDLVLAITTLNPAQRIRGAVLLGIAVAYLAGVHCGPGRARLPKEVLVAAIFTGGAMVFLEGGSPPILPGLLFAGLCLLNCMLIACWEDPIDRAQGGLGLAQRLPTLSRRLPEIALLIAALALASLTGPAAWLKLPVALSAFALLALHLGRKHLELSLRRALADAVLLTPLLL